MSRWIGLCLLIVFYGQIAWGISALPAHTVFYIPATGNTAARPYIELYWQIDPGTVQFTPDDKGIWRGKIKTIIEISHDTGLVASEKYYLQTTPASSLPAAQLQNIMDLHRYSVAPGKLHIKLSLSQDGYDKVFEYKDSVEIPQPGKIFYSQLQLLDTSYKTDLQDNMFLKNGNLQIPACINFLDNHSALMHYYTELHGTDKIPTSDLPLVQFVTVSRKEYDYPMMKLTQLDTIKPGKILPVLGQFKIDVLPSGNYYLNVVLKNNKGGDMAKSSMFFQRSNTKPVVIKDTTKADSTEPLFEKVSLFDLSTTFVAKYSVAQLKAIVKMLKPVASETELPNIEAFLKRPDETYMRYFVYNFWKTRTPADPEQGWEDYTQLVRQVNKIFGSKAKPGYETEPGFYYLKYGPPDQRHIVTAEEGSLPYEVWQYNAPGKQSSPGSFLFYNPGFMGNEYQLLHSTVKGEIRNTNWRANLYKSGGSTNNLNSRAEQIFQNN